MIKIIISFLTLILLTSTATAYDETPFENYNIRQKAMGGTQVTAIKDSTAFYQNPAFLALEDSFKVAIPRLSIGVNQDLLDKQSTIEDLMNSTDESSQIDALKALVPSAVNINASILPILTFTKKHFGITAFTNANIIGDILRPTSPTLYLEGQSTTTIQLGMASTISILNKDIYLGISPKFVSKSIIYDSSTGEDLFEFSQTDLLQYINGTQELNASSYSLEGFALDAGILFPYSSKRIEGLCGVTIKNIFSFLEGSKTVNNESTTFTENDDFILTVGTSFDYNFPIIKKFHFATDINLIAPTQSMFKRIHMGIEKKLTPVIALRGGINQGFIVGGFGINLFVLKVDYAFFAEEYSGTLGDDTVKSHTLQVGFLF